MQTVRDGGPDRSAATTSRNAAPRRPGLDGVVFVLALILTVVSGITTFEGMSRIFGNGNALGILGLVAAAAFTICIQCALTVFGWLGGKDLARVLSHRGGGAVSARSRSAVTARRFIIAGIFLGAAAVSAFFSYNTYFNGIYRGSEEERRRETAVPAFLGDLLTDLERAFDRGATASATAAVDVADGGWSGTLRDIADVAEAAGPRLVTHVRAAAERQAIADRERIAAAVRDEAARSDAASVADTARRNIPVLEAAIAGTGADLAKVRARLVEIDKQRDAERAEMERELAGIDGRKPGKGEKYRAAADRAGRLDKERSAVAASADRLSADMARDRQRLIAERQALALSETTAALPPGAPAPSVAVPLAIPSDPNGAVAALRAAETAFRRAPGAGTYRDAASACSVLKAALALDKEASADVEALACEEPAVAAAAGGHDRFLVAARTFAANCSEDARSKITNFDDAIAFGRRCTAAARGAGADVARADDRLTRFEGRYGSGRHEFAKTLESVALAPDIAGLAAFLSCLQDGLVFLLSFAADMIRFERRTSDDVEPVGEGDVDYAPADDDAPQVAAAKTILASARPVMGRGQRSRYTTRGEEHLALDPKLQANVDRLLKRLLRDNSARLVRGDDGEPTYEITRAGTADLDTEIRNAAALRQQVAAEQPGTSRHRERIDDLRPSPPLRSSGHARPMAGAVRPERSAEDRRRRVAEGIDLARFRDSGNS